MSDGQGDVPGYFVGPPANYAEPKEAEPQGRAEQNPVPVNTQPPGGYFVGPPTGHQQQEAAPVHTSNRPSFLAKCCPCLAGGGTAE